MTFLFKKYNNLHLLQFRGGFIANKYLKQMLAIKKIKKFVDKQILTHVAIE